MTNPPVLIIGAGLSGLACAIELQRAGRPILVLEASGSPGGRVQTDRHEGFLLDRGFQTLLTAYPHARALVPYAALELGNFLPGALIRVDGRLHKVSDPFRNPMAAWQTLRAPIGSMLDKVKLLRDVARVAAAPIDRLLTGPEQTTKAALLDRGYSQEMILRFFKPFFGGVFLESELNTTSRMLDFTLKMFASGFASLPSRGMGEIARQAAAQLSEGAIRYGCRVMEIADGRSVTLENGETLAGSATVIATEGPESRKLWPDLGPIGSKPATTLYYSAERSPLGEPMLALNGDGRGLINHLCVPSDISQGYAPPGRSLVSVSLVGDIPMTNDPLERVVRSELCEWFGPAVESWKHLRTYRIAHALPDEKPGWQDPPTRPARLAPLVHICGDHRKYGSLNAAIASGLRAARSVLAEPS